MSHQKDIGWEHAIPVGGDRKVTQCNYCGKIMHGGITRMKQHLAHISGQVEACPRVPKEIREVMFKVLKKGKSERAALKQTKESFLSAISESQMNTNMEEEDIYELNEEQISNLEKKQLKQSMKESRHARYMEEQGNVGTSSSRGTSIGTKRDLQRSFSMKEGRGMDKFLFTSKQKSIKQMFSGENAKRIGKAISKFFLFNGIPFNAAESGPYYQSMIDEIAKVGEGVKGPSGYQIGGVFLDEEIKELENCSLKTRWPTTGCTIM